MIQFQGSPDRNMKYLKGLGRIITMLLLSPRRWLTSLHLTAKDWHFERRFFRQTSPNTWRKVALSGYVHEETVDPYTSLPGTSEPTDLALLQSICRRYKACHYLEIGSWRGESLANVARVAEKCVSISLGPQALKSQKKGEVASSQLNLFTKNLSNVKQIEADSRTFDFRPWHGQFDVVFIDGNHGYDAVLSDTKNALKLLRNEHSVMIWHDCGHNFEDLRYEVICAIMDGIPREERQYLYRIVPSFCGIYTRESLIPSNRKEGGTPELLVKLNLSVKSYEEDQL